MRSKRSALLFMVVSITGLWTANTFAPSVDLNCPDIFCLTFTLDVSLNNLVGEGAFKAFDKKTLQRFKDLEYLEEDKKKTLFDLIDTYIRDAKGRKAFAH